MNSEILNKLSHLFSYKAEWLDESIYGLFTEPAYFPELSTPKPCFLLGGRGTGKTTTLRGLSYHGQFAFCDRDPKAVAKWTYYGIFYRVNTNRVTAFKGGDLAPEEWIKYFAHYLNLLLCGELAKFLIWFHEHVPKAPKLKRSQIQSITAALAMEPAATLSGLSSGIQDARFALESAINTISDQPKVKLSILASPIDIFIEELKKLSCFADRQFFFLIDEYENFEDYQQEVVNTVIKHSAPLYTFKVGVRELGFRRRTTLNPSEQLVHPADYVRINIGETLDVEKFEPFARKVCEARLAQIVSPTPRVHELFRTLSVEEEAVILDQQGSGLASQARSRLLSDVPSKFHQKVLEIPLLKQYFLVRRADNLGRTLESIWLEFTANQAKWDVDYDNHKVALLFTFGQGGTKNPKLYAGWRTYINMANCNIRYLVELVEQAIKQHLLSGEELDEPICFTTQTEAAHEVGKRNFYELQGLAVDGARLTKLLLGLGRLFQVLASNYDDGTPELTQFYLQMEHDSTQDVEAVRGLLNSAVNHLALIRLHGTKMSSKRDIADFDYMVHPVFCSFFVTSYRKKRKIGISADRLLRLTDEPRAVIGNILRDRALTEGGQMVPKQLEFLKILYE